MGPVKVSYLGALTLTGLLKGLAITSWCDSRRAEALSTVLPYALDRGSGGGKLADPALLGAVA